jgi:hypothetical protein
MTMNSVISKPRSVADVLGLGTLADGEPGMDPELLRAVYRHSRNEDGQRKLFVDDGTFKRGWIDLNSPEAARLISAFVPLDEGSNPRRAKQLAKANLLAQPWNDLLGIEALPIRCNVKIHGSKWGLRFESGEAKMRGREIINEQLPPIPTDPAKAAEATEVTSPASVSTVTTGNSAARGTPTADAADALRKAGLPA